MREGTRSPRGGTGVGYSTIRTVPANAHALVVAEGRTHQSVRQWMLMLHGILGRGSNLRTLARAVLREHPAWGIALVDLRAHGGSRGFAPPHTVERAALDLCDLELALPGPVRGVCGHSFGGKVALSYLARRGGSLSHVIDIDASPAARNLSADRSTTVAIIEMLEALPPTLPSRADLVERVVALGEAGAVGADRSLGEWLSMNLEPVPGSSGGGGGYRLALDMEVIRALLEDYQAADLWPAVESVPDETRLDVIIGERGGAFPPEDRVRLDAAARAQAGRLFVHPMPTGHWVHVEDFAGVVRIVVEALGHGA